MADDPFKVNYSEWSTEKLMQDLRWICRDGEKVLQQRWEITRNHVPKGVTKRLEWRDIPVEKEK